MHVALRCRLAPCSSLIAADARRGVATARRLGRQVAFLAVAAGPDRGDNAVAASSSPSSSSADEESPVAAARRGDGAPSTSSSTDAASPPPGPLLLVRRAVRYVDALCVQPVRSESPAR